MTTDLERLVAARAKAEEIAASFNAVSALESGPRLRIAIADAESGVRLATAFVSYSIPTGEPAPLLRLVTS